MLKKVFFSLLVLLIIGLSFGFVWLKLSVHGILGGPVNPEWRREFSRSSLWRSALGMHSFGDARAAYLEGSGGDIRIKVIPMQGTYINDDLLEKFSTRVSSITGKKVKYVILPSIPSVPETTSDELEQATEEQRQVRFWNRETDIFMIVALRSRENGEQLGSTFREDGIILYQDPLNRNYRRNENLEVYEQHALATLLHEFGHQLGLEHNSGAGCLMNETVEIPDREKIGAITSDFCPFEQEQLRNPAF